MPGSRRRRVERFRAAALGLSVPLRRRDPLLAKLLQQQADEAMARLPPMDGVALDVRRTLAARVNGSDTRI
jgi:hypothetical protein